MQGQQNIKKYILAIVIIATFSTLKGHHHANDYQNAYKAKYKIVFAKWVLTIYNYVMFHTFSHELKSIKIYEHNQWVRVSVPMWLAAASGLFCCLYCTTQAALLLITIQNNLLAAVNYIDTLLHTNWLHLFISTNFNSRHKQQAKY